MELGQVSDFLFMKHICWQQDTHHLPGWGKEFLGNKFWRAVDLEDPQCLGDGNGEGGAEYLMETL